MVLEHVIVKFVFVQKNNYKLINYKIAMPINKVEQI